MLCAVFIGVTAFAAACSGSKKQPNLSSSPAATGAPSVIATAPDGAAKTAGITLGEIAATAMLENRKADGANGPNTYRPATAPGVYVPTALPVVTHVATIKPLDEDAMLAEIARPGRLIVIAENHSVIGGLGEAVLALAMRNGMTGRMRQVGLPDAFLDAGALPTLHERYAISTSRLVTQVKSWL